MCEVVSKNIALKNPLFFKKLIFSNMCTFLSHCFETKNYHWVHTYRTYIDILDANWVVLRILSNWQKPYFCSCKLIEDTRACIHYATYIVTVVGGGRLSERVHQAVPGPAEAAHRERRELRYSSHILLDLGRLWGSYRKLRAQVLFTHIAWFRKVVRIIENAESSGTGHSYCLI